MSEAYRPLGRAGGFSGVRHASDSGFDAEDVDRDLYARLRRARLALNGALNWGPLRPWPTHRFRPASIGAAALARLTERVYP